MDRSENLKARGWRQSETLPGMWHRPPPRPSGWVKESEAIREQRETDRSHVDTMGSVIFYPTAEQAQTSPLLAACAARSMCERDVIGLLFAESEERMATLKRAVQMGAVTSPPAIRISADAGAVLLLAKLKSSEAIGAAWKALARAERAARDADEDANGEKMAAAYRAVGTAKAALRALGIDPDAADEPGQVPT